MPSPEEENNKEGGSQIAFRGLKNYKYNLKMLKIQKMWINIFFLF